MEARIARLESDVGHIASDMADVKIDVRSLRDKFDAKFDGLDAKFDAKFDALDAKFDEKFDGLNAKFDAKIDALDAKFDKKFDGVKDSIAKAKVWALVLYIALAGGLFGTLARGFDWI